VFTDLQFYIWMLVLVHGASLELVDISVYSLSSVYLFFKCHLAGWHAECWWWCWCGCGG